MPFGATYTYIAYTGEYLPGDVTKRDTFYLLNFSRLFLRFFLICRIGIARAVFTLRWRRDAMRQFLQKIVWPVQTKYR